MKKFFSFFAMLLFVGAMSAAEVSLTIENYGKTSFNAGGVRIEAAKGTSQTLPAYNANGKDLRVYAGGTLTISCEANITAVEFVISTQGKKRLAELSVNAGVATVKGTPDFTATWSGSAKEIVFTVGDKATYGSESSKAGQLDFTAVKITYEGEQLPDPEAEKVTINQTEGVYFYDQVAAEGWWQFEAETENSYLSISNIETKEIAGTYGIDDLDADYTMYVYFEGTDTTYVQFVGGSITLTVDAQTGNVDATGLLAGDDDREYDITLHFIRPKAEKTVTITFEDAVLDTSFISFGLFAAFGEDETNYVQIPVWVDEETESIDGDYTENDLDYSFYGPVVLIGEDEQVIYTASIHVVTNADGSCTITADILCYNNTLYKITMQIPAGSQAIENTALQSKAAKTIKNGMLLIEKNNHLYNALGQSVR